MRVFVVALGFLASAIARIENVNVARTIDLNTHVAKVRSVVDFVDDQVDVEEYLMPVPNHLVPKLAHVTAKQGKTVCDVKRDFKYDGSPGNIFYRITLQTPVKMGEKGTLVLSSSYSHVLEPYPAEISQSEDQLVRYNDTFVFYSLYPTKHETTKVRLPSKSVEKWSKREPTLKMKGTITYGPYDNTKPFSGQHGDLRVHFKNNSPFITLTSVIREVEVSHWGSVSVEESYDLFHSGAKLKGGFSRLDYSLHGQHSASFNKIDAVLPQEATGVYYRDQIGNVTTSRLRKMKTRYELELQPRFPIFGGWKTQWYMGYRLPTARVLRRNGNSFKLTIDFSTPILGVVVDDLTLKVILPEGSTNVTASVPFEVEQDETTRQTYLDNPMLGRPVLIMKAKNLVDEHKVPITVAYEFDQYFMLHEPLLLITGFLTFFTVMILALKLDYVFNIIKKAPKKKTE